MPRATGQLPAEEVAGRQLVSNRGASHSRPLCRASTVVAAFGLSSQSKTSTGLSRRATSPHAGTDERDPGLASSRLLLLPVRREDCARPVPTRFVVAQHNANSCDLQLRVRFARPTHTLSGQRDSCFDRYPPVSAPLLLPEHEERRRRRRREDARFARRMEECHGPSSSLMLRTIWGRAAAVSGVSEDLCRPERKRRSCLQPERSLQSSEGGFLDCLAPAASLQASRRRPLGGSQATLGL